VVGHVFPGIEHLFPARVRSSGFDYVLDDRYSNFQFTTDLISATIHGQSEYATRIGVVRDRRIWRLTMSCSCPYMSREKTPCKHLYALLLLACEAIETGRSALKVGELPIKVIAQVSARTIDPASSTPAAPPPPAPPSWSSVVRADPPTYEPAESTRESRILKDLRYVVDLEQSRIEQGLVLTVRRPFIQNHPRAEQSVKLTHQDVAHMPEPIDRSICGLLMGASDRQSSVHQYYGQSSVTRIHQWRISPEMFDTLLPMLSTSGRFFSSRGTEQPATALEVDESRTGSPVAHDAPHRRGRG
jgi:hypothetical protein